MSARKCKHGVMTNQYCMNCNDERQAKVIHDLFQENQKFNQMYYNGWLNIILRIISTGFRVYSFKLNRLLQVYLKVQSSFIEQYFK